ncbi:hypothetical protein SAMN05443580_1382 [Variovorax sp. OV084]|jgi:hypothetical protein|nr:hypothetical protein SAMN05443580_1382 [Variovorax sp. OV084]
MVESEWRTGMNCVRGTGVAGAVCLPDPGADSSATDCKFAKQKFANARRNSISAMNANSFTFVCFYWP